MKNFSTETLNEYNNNDVFPFGIPIDDDFFIEEILEIEEIGMMNVFIWFSLSLFLRHNLNVVIEIVT